MTRGAHTFFGLLLRMIGGGGAQLPNATWVDARLAAIGGIDISVLIRTSLLGERELLTNRTEALFPAKISC